MRERDKALVFVAVWLVALSAVWAAVEGSAPRTPGAAPGILFVRLVVEGPSWTIAHEAATHNNTVFRFLRESSATLGFEIGWVEYGWPYDDVFVTSIHGTRNDGARNLWWQYCVNGEYAAKGAAAQEVRDGDFVLWFYAPPGGSELCR